MSSFQVAGPLVWSSSMIFGSFVVGTIAVVARSWGEGDRARAEKTVAVSLSMAAVLGSVLGGLLALGAPFAVGLFGLPAQAAGAAITYLRVVASFFPFLFVAYTGVAVLRSSGDTRTPLLLAIVANVVNILGNYGLIFGRWGLPEWGIYGAGLASGVAHAIEASLLLVVLVRGRRGLRLIPSRFFQGPPVLRSILRISFPSFVERVFFHAGFLIFAGMVTRLGELASAANQACIALESFSFIPAGAFGIAGATIIGQKLGARLPDQARIGGAWAVWMSVGFLSFMGLLYLTIPGSLVALFSRDPQVLALAVPCLMIAALAQPTMAVGISLSEGLKGAGDTRSPLIITLIGIWGVRLGASWLLAYRLGLGLPGIWLATALDWAVRATLLLVVFRRGHWVRIKV
ncbi:MAG: MATE family efflux transporter [Planctomycetota bacterium]|nr:MATE family efflux transporter [Planctomycetota bacterium]